MEYLNALINSISFDKLILKIQLNFSTRTKSGMDTSKNGLFEDADMKIGSAILHHKTGFNTRFFGKKEPLI